MFLIPRYAICNLNSRHTIQRFDQNPIELRVRPNVVRCLELREWLVTRDRLTAGYSFPVRLVVFKKVLRDLVAQP